MELSHSNELWVNGSWCFLYSRESNQVIIYCLNIFRDANIAFLHHVVCSPCKSCMIAETSYLYYIYLSCCVERIIPDSLSSNYFSNFTTSHALLSSSFLSPHISSQLNASTNLHVYVLLPIRLSYIVWLSKEKWSWFQPRGQKYLLVCTVKCTYSLVPANRSLIKVSHS